ncbi:MAG: hypothetical protein JWQ72_394 [Polaromonas sp.]|nr:hypothetical protein [Polaromonas sp.]
MRQRTMLALRWCAAMALAPAAMAQTQTQIQIAPGEDPVILTKRVAVQGMPSANARGSSPLESQAAMPAWMKAKIVKYEAKASSAQPGGILTDADAQRSATSDGFKKTCVQEVGSTTAPSSTPGKPGIGNNQQIVVLKGDLVNICK